VWVRGRAKWRHCEVGEVGDYESQGEMGKVMMGNVGKDGRAVSLRVKGQVKQGTAAGTL
jgi:hypothetical protein